MPVKVAINGYGRIGRNILRALYEGKRRSEIQVVAINDLGDAITVLLHLSDFTAMQALRPLSISAALDLVLVRIGRTDEEGCALLPDWRARVLAAFAAGA